MAIYLPLFVDVLISLLQKEKTLSELQYELKITYTHLSKLKKEMSGLEWVDERKDGRNNFIFLTEKGKNIALKFSDVNQLINRRRIKNESYERI